MNLFKRGKKHPNAGNFKNRLADASAGGKKGGPISSGNFKYHPDRAVLAGRKGGLATQKRRHIGVKDSR